MKTKILIILCLLLTACTSNPTTPPTEQPVIPPTTDARIQVDMPQPQDTIQSPITISGQARGYWFFEATAPVMMTDWNGLIIGEGHIQATEDWMTEEFVPFKGTLNFEVPENTPYKRGTLIVQRHNASGLPENDAAVEIPIYFE